MLTLPSHYGKSVVFPCVRLRVVALATTGAIHIFNVELLYPIFLRKTLWQGLLTPFAACLRRRPPSPSDRIRSGNEGQRRQRCYPRGEDISCG